MDRRKFLKHTGIITAGTLLVPSFLKGSTLLKNLERKGKRLVVIQLSGGNDGLNTVVPYGHDAYYKNRSVLAFQPTELMKLDEQFGLHPALKGLFDLKQKGLLSIVNAVGYPNPTRSHFRSMDIWHTASHANEYKTTGWLGRFLDNHCEHPYEGIELNGELSLALKGQEQAGIALTDPNTFYQTIHSDFYQKLATPKTDNSELDYLYRMFHDTQNSAEYIYDQYRLKTNRAEYANNPFAQQLKKIATLMKSDIQTPVFYTSLGGFDTHVHQKNAQQRLLDKFDKGVTSFVNDLQNENLMKDTTILVFSEFGRRFKENASRGTDHGAANVLFVIDTGLDKHAHELNQIDLEDLENGDPKFKIDFRSVYQEVLENTLKVDPMNVLGEKFDSLQLFA